MSAAKRRPATPAGEEPTSAAPAPEVPIVASDAPVPDELVTPVLPVETTDGAELLGPDGEPIAVDAEGRATKQPPRRSRGRYPLPVWPD